jgi:glucose 1-dehydrogenase
MNRLENKVALITGAGDGIGQAIAVGFAKEGAIVIINDISEEKAQNTLNLIYEFNENAKIIIADLSKVDEIHGMFVEIKSKFERLDILVNNAGKTGWSSIWNTTEVIFDAVINLNLKGTFFCTIEAAKIMREQKSGSIINISTICAELGVKNLPVYSASKGGIQALSKQLAIELAPYNIRVNTIGPGPINVERNLQEDQNYKSNWGAMIPLGRTGEPEEVVGPAIFLASDDASFVTGQLFFIDGGWTAQGKIPENSMDSQLKNSLK